MQCIGLGDDLFGQCSGARERDGPHSFIAVDGGESFSIGVTQEGDVAGWGSAFYGELGDVDDGGTLVQDRICSPPVAIKLKVKCRFVACGIHHAMVLSADGEVHAWGRNARGQTGLLPLGNSQVSKPAKVEFSTTESTCFVGLAAGGNHSLALQSTGHVWSWGDNSNGQLGIGAVSQFESMPQRVAFPHCVSVNSIAAGYAHSAALASDGRVLTFGWGLYHQLGHGTTEDSHSPQVVDALDGIEGGMRAVACGTWHTAAISSQGDVYTWGWGPDGQLGPSQSSSARMPAVVDTDDEYFAEEDEGHHAVHVACGARLTVVASRTGSVFCWGRKGSFITSSAEQSIRSRRIASVTAGHSHVLVLASADND